MIKLMNRHGLTVRDRFAAESIGLQLSERQSTLSLTVSDRAPVISLDDWLQIESGPGAGIVWRVKTIDEQIEKKTRTISAEHAIGTLRDVIMFGEVKSTDISGGKGNPTARQAVNYILGRQSDWVLGDIAYNVTNPYSFNGDDLYAALETVSGSLEDCIWEYDFSAYPFRLYIRRMDSTVCSEMRTDRNIRTLRKTIDRSRMYTRFYPIGKNNLHIDGDYVAKNEGLYGTVSKTETDQSLGTKDQLRAWAVEKLNRHCEPAVTVTISGLELAEVTGEPLDSFRIGKMCRVPLPEFATNITERVTKLSYSDTVRDPMSVTVTLANELNDVAKILKDASASGGRAGRAGAKNDEEDHAWIVDTSDKVELVAEAVAGKDGDGANWSRVATLTVDGNGIDARVVKAEGELITATTRIQQNEDAITLEAQNRASADNTLNGKITVNAGKISLVVEERSGNNVIKAASIVTSINDEGSSVAISADHVSITGSSKLSGSLEISDGDLTIKRSAVVQGHMTLITAGSYIQAPQFNVTSSGKIQFIGTGTGETYNLTTAVLKGMVKEFSVEAGVLTLTPFYGDPVTFSRATTLTGAWGSGADADYFVVTASPQGNKYRYNPPLRLNGTTQYSNFSAEVTETTGSTTVAKKSISGYLLMTADGENSYVDVNTASDGTGTAVARIGVGSIYKPAASEIDFDQLSIEGQTASISGREEAGSFRKSLLEAPGYLFFRIKCRGRNKLYYLTVNT